MCKSVRFHKKPSGDSTSGGHDVGEKEEDSTSGGSGSGKKEELRWLNFDWYHICTDALFFIR